MLLRPLLFAGANIKPSLDSLADPAVTLNLVYVCQLGRDCRFQHAAQVLCFQVLRVRGVHPSQGAGALQVDG